MKKKYISILVLVVLIILIALSIELIFSKNFYINKNNRFFFSSKFSSLQIRQFVKLYSFYINDFFNNNNFTFSKIEEQNLYLIICKDSFNEFSKDNKFLKAFISQLGKDKKYIEKILSISKIENIEYRYCFGLNTILLSNKSFSNDKKNKINDKGNGINNNGINNDKINEQDGESIINLYKFLILTYHQHLIYNNLSIDLKTLFDIKSGIIPFNKDKYNDMLIEYIYANFLIDSIESFYQFIFSNENLVENMNFNYLKNFISKDKTFQSKYLIITDELISNFINSYDKEKILYNSFEDFYVDLITENLVLNEDSKILIQNKFVAKIIKEYGFDKLKKFINTLYNNKIDSITKIFEINFGISFKDFLKIIFYP